MLLFRGGPPRRAPYPYDAVLSGIGLMLGEAQPGAGKAIPSTKPPDLSNVLPQQYAYEGLNPIFGTVKVWEDWSGGFGQRIERAPAERENRYYYATNADLSVKGMWLKGPAITTLVPGTVDATNGVTHFFEIASTLFALNGRYVQKRTSDTDWNTGRQDFGVGKAATDVEVFYTNAGGGANYAYIAMGESELFYRFDGTTYTQHGTLYANSFRAVGRELYRGVSTNQLAKVNTDSDPWTAANWSSNNAFNVGDKASAINRLAVTSTGVLLIFKTDGIYTLDQSGNDRKLFPHLRFAPLAANGKGFGAWLNALFVPYGQALYQIEDEVAFSVREKITDVGPEKLNGNDSPVRGRITAFAGHESLHAYAAIYNGTDSYLLKLVRDEQGQFVWHGSITAAFTGVQITALHKSTIGAAANHTRLYLGFSDGTVGWFTLPNTSNPAADGCFPAEVGVSAPTGVEAAMRRWYDGDLVEITTAHGYHLTGTPNHPVLTDRGWVGLGSLIEGDHVFCHLPREHVAASQVDVDDVYAPISQVFDLAAVTGATQRVTGVYQQFHGDGQQTDVDVVAVDGQLWHRVQAALAQPPNEHGLPVTNPAASASSALDIQRAAPHLLGTTTASGVGSMGTRQEEAAPFQAHSIQSRLSDLTKATPRDASLNEPAVNRGDGDVQLLRDLRHAFAGLIAPDDVCVVKRKSYRGHVYNLQTKSGWYSASGVIVHNSYTFSTALASIYPPTWGTATFASDQKGLQALTVNGLNLSTTNYVQGNYRTDPTASFQALGTNFQTVPWQKAAFAVGAQGVVVDFRFDLVSTGASASPQVTSVALSWRLQTELRQVYTLHVLADDGLVKRDGTPLRFGRARIKDLMEQVSGGAGSTTLLLPNEDSRTVAVANFGATRAWDARLRKWYGAYEIACAEVAATTTYGTVQRSGAYRVGDLSSFNVAQLGSL